MLPKIKFLFYYLRLVKEYTFEEYSLFRLKEKSPSAHFKEGSYFAKFLHAPYS